MLLLLEGHVVHFAAPKTSYSEAILFQKDTPIFAPAKAPITFVKNGLLDERETEMMTVRWRIFTFRNEIPLDKRKVVHLCGHCFASLLLSYRVCCCCLCFLVCSKFSHGLRNFSTVYGTKSTENIRCFQYCQLITYLSSVH